MVTRRNLLSGALSSLLLPATARRSSLASEKTDENTFSAGSSEISDWMKAWMTEHKAVTGSLHVGRFADPMYFLLRPITWKPNPDQADTYQAVTAPTGFVTDFASVPRAFWSLLRPDGLYTYPAILHDYLYWTQEKPKSFADNVLKFGMEDFGVSKSIVTAIYQAVSLFGQSAWDENTRRKAAGEQRILQKFPDDPRITWSAWKERTDAFR